MTPEELEREADRLLAEWALSQPRASRNPGRGRRKHPGRVLRSEGILTRASLDRVEGIEVPLSAFGDGRDLVEEDE